MWWRIAEGLRGFGESVYWCLLGKWMWELFRYGPGRWFWMGLPDVDVCCQLAQGTRATDWIDANTGEATSGCTSLIQRSYEAFAIAVHTGLYVSLLLVVIMAVTKRLGASKRQCSFLEYKPGRVLLVR
jgi:hypothetical protein